MTRVQIIMFSDLECDFINPIDLCNKLNQVASSVSLCLMLIVCCARVLGAWIVGVGICFEHELDSASYQPPASRLPHIPVSPIIIYISLLNIQRLVNRRHIFDATEIFRTLPEHKKECFIKLGFYMVSFFYYLYRMIMGLLEG